MIAVTEEYRFGAAVSVSPYAQVASFPFKIPISIERRGREKKFALLVPLALEDWRSELARLVLARGTASRQRCSK